MAPSRSTSPHPAPAITPDDGLRELHRIIDLVEEAIRAGDAAELVDTRSEFGLSETLQHAAQSIGYAIDGYPELKPAAVRHSIGRLVKHLFLTRGRMKHDLSAPLAGAPALDPATADRTAAAELSTAVERLAAFEGTLQPHPVYGVCTVPQSARLQAMHLHEHLPGLATRA